MIPHVVRPLEPWTGRPTPYDARRTSPFSATWTDTLILLDRGRTRNDRVICGSTGRNQSVLLSIPPTPLGWLPDEPRQQVTSGRSRRAGAWTASGATS